MPTLQECQRAYDNQHDNYQDCDESDYWSADDNYNELIKHFSSHDEMVKAVCNVYGDVTSENFEEWLREENVNYILEDLESLS